jgi:hypothetical protein
MRRADQLSHHLLPWLERMRAEAWPWHQFLLERRAGNGASLPERCARPRLPKADRKPPNSDSGARGSRSRVAAHYSSTASRARPMRPLANFRSSARQQPLFRSLQQLGVGADRRQSPPQSTSRCRSSVGTSILPESNLARISPRFAKNRSRIDCFVHRCL